MSASAVQAFASVPVSFSDGLGDRYVCADAGTGDRVEVLRLAHALTAVPSVEFSLRERTARLANFRPASYGRVLRVDRLQDGALAVVSEHVEGLRLSNVLVAAGGGGLRIETAAALAILRQLLQAAALLHEYARDVAHGLIAPERLIVTTQGRLVLVEHVFGAAIEQLQFGRDRLWAQFGTAVPASAGGSRMDHRADVNGIGITSLSLLLGRALAPGEFPHAVAGLLMQVHERLSPGDERPLPNGLRNWLARTLQLDVRRAFASAPEALAAFEEAIAGASSLAPAPAAVQALLAPLFPDFPRTIPEPPARSVPAVPAPDCLRTIPAGATSDVQPLGALIAVDDLVAPHTPTDGALPQRRGRSGAARRAEQAGADVPQPQQPADRRVESGGEIPPEDEPAAPRRTRWRAPRWWYSAGTKPLSRWKAMAAAAAVLTVALTGGVFLYRGESASGLLVVQSSPAGVDIFVDGVHRGVTPARLALSSGSHILELRGRGVPRVIPLQVPAGGQISQYLEFADTPRTGMLVVHSDPAGAAVLVDGVARGTTPITIEGLPPGSREVVLRNEQGSSRHIVNVLAGTAASLVARVVTPAVEGPVSGWVRITAPFTLEIYEDARLIGTTDTDRLMLAAGRHVLELVNGPLGYRATHVVQVTPGKVTTLPVQLPTGRLDLNASPWAEVWIDGKSVGETPIGNLELPIGPYELVFRHPELGERRHAVSVTTVAPVRVSMAMRE